MPYERLLQRYLCYTAAEASTYAIWEDVAEVSLLYYCTGIYILYEWLLQKYVCYNDAGQLHMSYERLLQRYHCYTAASGIYICHT
jgi:hypothetical protein